MDFFDFKCDFSNTDLTPQDIIKILPPWKTRLLEVNRVEGEFQQIMLRFLIAATTADDIKQWIKMYENHTYTTYYIRDTPTCKGNHITFKQILNCHHNARNLGISDETKRKFVHKRKRNTNCPSHMKIKMFSLKKRKRLRPHTVIHDPEMPCEVELYVMHNHEIENAEALSFRRVSDDIKEKIIGLFHRGHSASTAKDLLKMNVCLNHDDYDVVLNDRKYCPNYNYCAYLHTKYKKSNKGIEMPRSDEEVIELLVKYLEEFNDKTNDDSARLFSYDGNVIICICPPIFRRIHENIKFDLVFLDSVQFKKQKPTENDYTLFLLYTNGVSCLLPLAIIITYSSATSCIFNSFEVLKEMLGESLFGGNVDGPSYIIVGDDLNELTAVTTAFNNSQVYLNIYSLMESVYLWLVKPANSIPKEQQLILFNLFRRVIFSDSEEECEEEYGRLAVVLEAYPKFTTFLRGYWERKELWALCFREDDVKNSVKAVLKEQIFERVKDLNIVQVLDFYLNKFMPETERKIMEIANKSYIEYFMNNEMIVPPKSVMDRVQKLGEKLYLVPKEGNNDVYFIVNLETFSCTCIDSDKPCDHLNWLTSIHPEDKTKIVDDLEIKKLLHFIVTGTEPLENNEIEKQAKLLKFSEHMKRLSEPISWVKVRQPDGTIQQVPVYERSKKVSPMENTDTIGNLVQTKMDIVSQEETTLSEQIQSKWSQINVNKNGNEASENTTDFNITISNAKIDVESELSTFLIPNDLEDKKIKDEAKRYLQESTNHLMNLGLRSIERNPIKSLEVLKQLQVIIEKYKNLVRLTHTLKVDSARGGRKTISNKSKVKRRFPKKCE